MKYLRIILLICFLVSNLFVVAIVNSHASLLPFLEGTEKLSGDSVLFSAKYYSVYGYFDLIEKYDTPLKMDIFKKTQEFKDLEKEYERAISELYNKTYYIRIVIKRHSWKESVFFGEIDWDEAGSSWSGPMSLEFSSYYDLQKGGFILKFPRITDDCYPDNKFPKTFWRDGNIIFDSLPVKIFPTSGWCYPKSISVCEQELLFPMDKEKGLIVENNISKIEIYFIFKIDNHGQDYQKFGGSCQKLGFSGYSYRRVIPSTVRVVMRNSQNGDIYFDKTYTKEGSPQGKNKRR